MVVDDRHFESTHISRTFFRRFSVKILTCLKSNRTGDVEYPAVLGREEYHSTDFGPCDFFLYSKLKGFIKRTCFKDADAIKRAVTTDLRGIPEELS